MTLQEIKNQVTTFFPGMNPEWIKGKVKEMTKGDLRTKATWAYALNLLKANQVEELPSIGVKITRLQIKKAITALDALPEKSRQANKIILKTVEKAIAVMDALPLREIRPNVYIAGQVEGAKPLVA